MDNLIWLLLILIAAGLVALVIWFRQNKLPRLVYTPLPPYDIPDLILVGGVLVENRGRALARNIKIDIQYGEGDPARIKHLHVACDEPYIVRGGGEQYNFATIRLRQLGPGKKLVVYWAAGQVLAPRVSVTSFQPNKS